MLTRGDLGNPSWIFEFHGPCKLLEVGDHQPLVQHGFLKYEVGIMFSGEDKLMDFDVSEGDAIDIADVLTGYDPLTDIITDFVQITENGGHSYLAIDHDGGGNNYIQVAKVNWTTGLTDEQALETSGNLIRV